MLKKFKQTVLGILKSVGVFGITQKSNWRRNRLLIIGYHGFSLDDEHKWDPALFMRPEYFRSRLQKLKEKNFTVLPLGEAVRRLYENTLPDRCVVLTFDDGFYNFYKVAHPILKEFNYPATLYLTTYYVDFNRPVFDSACSYILWKKRGTTLNLQSVLGESVEFNLTRDEDLIHAYSHIISYARQHSLAAEEKDQIAARLGKALGFDYDELCEKRLFNLLNRDEVRALAAEGVDVQLHTHRHRLPLNYQLFTKEIEDNRAYIESLTGAETNHFCYPSGIFDDKFTPWLTNFGVTTATTCEPGLASCASHPLLLPRLIDTSPMSLIEFEGWLSGVSSILPRRQKVYNPGAESYTLRSDVSVHD